ncbi:hypothetical protein V496_03448 [Pseudogymnoascus sp. VKM F-4515 (FW-2607)]|nr:hypothetical protein V496_03448 [Pseudogymnoascus sp. VKM F-4515 (FW-2607)]
MSQIGESCDGRSRAVPLVATLHGGRYCLARGMENLELCIQWGRFSHRPGRDAGAGRRTALVPLEVASEAVVLMDADPLHGLDAKSMPKIELHAHLSGSISPACLHEIWLSKKQRDADGAAALSDPLQELAPSKAFDLVTFFPLFSKFIYELCNDAESISYSTKSVLQDFQDDGVVYLELRTTPRLIKQAGISKEAYVQLVLSTISSFESPTMVTQLILSIDRRNSEEEASEVVDLALRYRDQGVVGVDLCGDPAKGNVDIFRSAFAKAKEKGLKTTIHFAEAQQSSSEHELLTLLSFEPDRIGHVIHVPDAIKEVIIERKLGLELCLSCNVKFKMTSGSFADHHFMYWKGTGCPITLCTDDVGVVGSALSNEYALIAEHFGLEPREVYELAQSGIETVFGGDDEKERLRKLMWR